MQNKRKWKNFFLSILTVTALSLSSCSDQMDITKPPVEKKDTIALIVKMNQSDYWKTVRMGAEAAAKEFNVKLAVSAPENEDDVKQQIQLVDQAVKKGVEGLILAASDYMELARVTDRVGNLGIPVISIESEVGSTKVRSFIGTNNYKAGRLAAEELVNHIGAIGNVAVMDFVRGARNGEQREEGLMDYLSQYPGIDVVERAYCESDVELADKLAGEIIERYENLDGIVALNSIASVGVAKAIQRLGMDGKVKVISFDSTTEIMGYLQDGVTQATIVQSPFTMGYLGVKQAVEAIQGKQVDERIETVAKVIDLENMFWMENQKLLFPFVK